MKNKLCFTINILVILFLANFVSAAEQGGLKMTDNEYKEFIATSSSFKNVDRMLSSAWRQAKSKLSSAEYQTILMEQKLWIGSGRDEDAKQYMTSMSKAEAYANATMDRVDELMKIIDSGKDSEQEEIKDQEQASSVTDNVKATSELTTQSNEQENILTQKAQDNSQVEVTVSGQGSTKIEALNAAWSEAVRLGCRGSRKMRMAG